MIQFCRYAVMANGQGAKVILAAQKPLLALLRNLGANVTVMDQGRPIPRFDYHCPLLSLPLAFGTTVQTVPNATPYLHANPETVLEWRRIIGTAGFRIGICWQGSATRPELERAFPLTAFAPLARLPSNTYSSKKIT